MTTRTVEITDESNNEKVTYMVDRVQLSQLKTLSPILHDNAADGIIPLTINGPFEWVAMKAIMAWLQQEKVLTFHDTSGFKAAVVLADKFDVPLLREALTVCFLYILMMNFGAIPEGEL